MATPSRQPDPEPDAVNSARSGDLGSESREEQGTEKSRPQDSATGTAPLVEDRKDDGGNKRQINAARMEVRVRRIALLLLVLVPLLYFIVQSLR